MGGIDGYTCTSAGPYEAMSYLSEMECRLIYIRPVTRHLASRTHSAAQSTPVQVGEEFSVVVADGDGCGDRFHKHAAGMFVGRTRIPLE